MDTKHTLILVAAALAVGGMVLLAQPATRQAPPLEVHEWGTFTSVTQPDGKAAWWSTTSVEALPPFVYKNSPISNPFTKQMAGTIHMETPELSRRP